MIMEKKVHFRFDFDWLTERIRLFWAEGEYAQALAIMVDCGISADNAKEVIRGKLKMAQYPNGVEGTEGWLVEDDWKPNLGLCLWGKYPDPDDHKFFKMINRYGVKPLSEARRDIEIVIGDLKCTVYWPDKRRLIDYLRKEKRYHDEIYTFFNLPFPETVEIDCEPDQVLPYSNPWSVENFRREHKKALEVKERDSIIGGKVSGAAGLMTNSGDLLRREETKPKKTKIVIDNAHIVYLEIHSWVGTALGASHYYGELKDRDKTVQLKTKLTHRQATKLNRDKEFKDFKAGDETTGFDSKELLIKEALKQWKSEFPHSTLLVEGRSSVSGPQEIIEGPDELKKAVNPLAQRADQIDWYTYRKHETEMQSLNDQWEKLMLKFGYAKELQL